MLWHHHHFALIREHDSSIPSPVKRKGLSVRNRRSILHAANKISTPTKCHFLLHTMLHQSHFCTYLDPYQTWTTSGTKYLHFWMLCLTWRCGRHAATPTYLWAVLVQNVLWNPVRTGGRHWFGLHLNKSTCHGVCYGWLAKKYMRLRSRLAHHGESLYRNQLGC